MAAQFLTSVHLQIERLRLESIRPWVKQRLRPALGLPQARATPTKLAAA